jgi:hypothetical protein
MRKFMTTLLPWKVILLFPLLFFFSLSQGFAADITLEWDANTEPDLHHYVVYWGTSPRGIQDYLNNSGYIDKSQTTYTVIGLNPDQYTYYFAAKAFDTELLESDYCAEIDTKPPQITSPPTVTSVTDTTATIEWSTDERANSVVNYRKELTTYTTITIDQSVTNHSVTLTGLTSGSYTFYVSSTDIGGIGPPDHTVPDNNPSGFYTFQTGAGSDTTDPQITSPPTVTNITDKTAVIEWQTRHLGKLPMGKY